MLVDAVLFKWDKFEIHIVNIVDSFLKKQFAKEAINKAYLTKNMRRVAIFECSWYSAAGVLYNNSEFKI